MALNLNFDNQKLNLVHLIEKTSHLRSSLKSCVTTFQATVNPTVMIALARSAPIASWSKAVGAGLRSGIHSSRDRRCDGFDVTSFSINTIADDPINGRISAQ